MMYSYKEIMLLVFKLKITLLSLVLLMTSAYAFGVSTPYFENNTIPLELDQVFEYKIIIQNAEDLGFNVNLSYETDGDIAVLRNTDFFIPPESYNNEFIFDVKVPNTSLVGDVYTLDFYATPILNYSGQVPMNVRIKRSVDFVIVDEGGVGVSTVELTWLQKILRWIGAIIERIYVYVLIVLAVIILYFIGKRLWDISKKFASNVTQRRGQQGVYSMISQAKTTSDVKNLIKLIPEKQLDSMKIRKQLSKKLESLGDKRKARYVLVYDSKDKILRNLDTRKTKRRKK